MPLLSVIIPVYNVAPYLEECLASVVGQDYQDLEILCIDDGSTDGSSQILDEWSEKDHRIRVIHQENQGPSRARNIGIQHARGIYLSFVDSDDTVLRNIFTTTLPILMEKHLDTLLFSYQTIPDGKTHSPGFPVNLVCDYHLLFASNNAIQSKNSLCFSWRYIFKTSILKDNNLLFDEQVKIGNDMIFNIDALCHSHRIMIIDTPLYCYRTNNPNSLQSKKYKPNLESSYTRMYMIKKQQILKYNLGYCSSYPLDLARVVIFRYLPLFVNNAFCRSGGRVNKSEIKNILSLQMFQEAFKTIGLKLNGVSIKEYLFYLALRYQFMPFVFFEYNRLYGK